jgi:hypothetical protein
MTRLTQFAALAFISSLAACGEPSSAAGCGDNVCGIGESPASCPEDCEKPDAGVTCGNTKCETGETPDTCLADCKPTCGDNLCNGNETQASCPVDCNAKLKISNESGSTFYYIYFWACGQSNNYVNHLTGSLPYGYYVQYDTMTPGCYNLEARTSGSARTVSSPNVKLTAAELYTWSISN